MSFQKTRKVAAYVAAALLFLAAVGSSLASAQQQPIQTQQDVAPANGSMLDAQQIYETDNIIADADVKTLVVAIPDNAGSGRSAWEGFLPSNATVAIGTTLVVLNADVNTTHTITVSNAETDQSVTREIPYENTTGIMLESPGEYTFKDEAVQISGTVKVVENSTLTDDPVTNASKPAVGLFIAPANIKSNFEAHLNTLGFNAVSSYNFSIGTQNASSATINSIGSNNNTNTEEMTLFVWTQEVSHPNTIDGRLASKTRMLEEALYPENTAKQTTTPITE
ncbi:MAG: hypothetical protein AB1351_02640 [Thermoproteota archaeon]